MKMIQYLFPDVITKIYLCRVLAQGMEKEGQRLFSLILIYLREPFVSIADNIQHDQHDDDQNTNIGSNLPSIDSTGFSALWISLEGLLSGHPPG